MCVGGEGSAFHRPGGPNGDSRVTSQNHHFLSMHVPAIMTTTRIIIAQEGASAALPDAGHGSHHAQVSTHAVFKARATALSHSWLTGVETEAQLVARI